MTQAHSPRALPDRALTEAQLDALLASVGVPLTDAAPNGVPMPLADFNVPCGFPSPASDFAVDDIDLAEELCPHPESCYVLRAGGDSMIDAGIAPGDLIVVDRSQDAHSGDIVLAIVDGAFTVKRFRLVKGRPELHSGNAAANYPTIRPTEFDGFQIVGVIVSSMKKFRRRY